MKSQNPNPRTVRAVQLGLLAVFWAGAIGIITWIVRLILLSLELHDIPSASVAISLVAIPVFLLLLVLANYVFLGLLWDGTKEPHPTTDDER